MTTSLHFAEALLPTGWARNVRVTLADGCFARVTPDAPPQPGDQHFAAALPGDRKSVV